MCIREGDEWKTNFQTFYGHFKYAMMHFGLTNAHAIFQNSMNNVFHEYLDDFMGYHIDDILIFSQNVEGMNHMFDLFWTSSKTIQPSSSCQFLFSKILYYQNKL